jgi:prevent-host-death family protein
MDTWQLQEAKNKFSEVVNLAISGKPQLVTRHGKPVAVVISAEDYAVKMPSGIDALEAVKKPQTFGDFMRSMPKFPDEWFANGADPFERIQGTLRETDFDADDWGA